MISMAVKTAIFSNIYYFNRRNNAVIIFMSEIIVGYLQMSDNPSTEPNSSKIVAFFRQIFLSFCLL